MGCLSEKEFLVECEQTGKLAEVNANVVRRLGELWVNFYNGYQQNNHFQNVNSCLETLLLCTGKVVLNASYSKKNVIPDDIKQELGSKVEGCATLFYQSCPERDSPQGNVLKAVSSIVKSDNVWRMPVLNNIGTHESINIPNEKLDLFWSEGWTILQSRLEYLSKTTRDPRYLTRFTAILISLIMKGIKVYSEPVQPKETDLYDPYLFPYSRFLEYLELYGICVFKHSVDRKFLALLDGQLLLKVIDRLSLRSSATGSSLCPDFKSWKFAGDAAKHLAATFAWEQLKYGKGEYVEDAFIKWSDLFNTEGVDEAMNEVLNRIDDVNDTLKLCRIAKAHVHRHGKTDQTRTNFVELYVRASTRDLDTLNEIKVNLTQQNQIKKAELEKSLSLRYVELAKFFKEFPKTAKDCILTAFSLRPSISLLKILFPKEEIGEVDSAEDKENIEPKMDLEDFKDVDMEAVRSSFGGEDRNLPRAHCSDLENIIKTPQYGGFLEWGSNEQLLERCRKLLKENLDMIENRELKDLNVDYDKCKDYKPQFDPADDGTQVGYSVEQWEKRQAAIQRRARAAENKQRKESNRIKKANQLLAKAQAVRAANLRTLKNAGGEYGNARSVSLRKRPQAEERKGNQKSVSSISFPNVVLKTAYPWATNGPYYESNVEEHKHAEAFFKLMLPSEQLCKERKTGRSAIMDSNILSYVKLTVLKPYAQHSSSGRTKNGPEATAKSSQPLRPSDTEAPTSSASQGGQRINLPISCEDAAALMKKEDSISVNWNQFPTDPYSASGFRKLFAQKFIKARIAGYAFPGARDKCNAIPCQNNKYGPSIPKRAKYSPQDQKKGSKAIVSTRGRGRKPNALKKINPTATSPTPKLLQPKSELEENAEVVPEASVKTETSNEECPIKEPERPASPDICDTLPPPPPVEPVRIGPFEILSSLKPKQLELPSAAVMASSQLPINTQPLSSPMTFANPNIIKPKIEPIAHSTKEPAERTTCAIKTCAFLSNNVRKKIKVTCSAFDLAGMPHQTSSQLSNKSEMLQNPHSLAISKSEFPDSSSSALPPQSVPTGKAIKKRKIVVAKQLWNYTDTVKHDTSPNANMSLNPPLGSNMCTPDTQAINSSPITNSVECNAMTKPQGSIPPDCVQQSISSELNTKQIPVDIQPVHNFQSTSESLNNILPSVPNIDTNSFSHALPENLQNPAKDLQQIQSDSEKKNESNIIPTIPSMTTQIPDHFKMQEPEIILIEDHGASKHSLSDSVVQLPTSVGTEIKQPDTTGEENKQASIQPVDNQVEQRDDKLPPSESSNAQIPVQTSDTAKIANNLDTFTTSTNQNAVPKPDEVNTQVTCTQNENEKEVTSKNTDTKVQAEVTKGIVSNNSQNDTSKVDDESVLSPMSAENSNSNSSTSTSTDITVIDDGVGRKSIKINNKYHFVQINIPRFTCFKKHSKSDGTTPGSKEQKENFGKVPNPISATAKSVSEASADSDCSTSKEGPGSSKNDSKTITPVDSGEKLVANDRNAEINSAAKKSSILKPEHDLVGEQDEKQPSIVLVDILDGKNVDEFLNNLETDASEPASGEDSKENQNPKEKLPTNIADEVKHNDGQGSKFESSGLTSSKDGDQNRENAVNTEKQSEFGSAGVLEKASTKTTGTGSKTDLQLEHSQGNAAKPFTGNFSSESTQLVECKSYAMSQGVSNPQTEAKSNAIEARLKQAISKTMETNTKAIELIEIIDDSDTECENESTSDLSKRKPQKHVEIDEASVSSKGSQSLLVSPKEIQKFKKLLNKAENMRRSANGKHKYDDAEEITISKNVIRHLQEHINVPWYKMLIARVEIQRVKNFPNKALMQQNCKRSSRIMSKPSQVANKIIKLIKATINGEEGENEDDEMSEVVTPANSSHSVSPERSSSPAEAKEFETASQSGNSSDSDIEFVGEIRKAATQNNDHKTSKSINDKKLKPKKKTDGKKQVKPKDQEDSVKQHGFGSGRKGEKLTRGPKCRVEIPKNVKMINTFHTNKDSLLTVESKQNASSCNQIQSNPSSSHLENNIGITHQFIVEPPSPEVLDVDENDPLGEDDPIDGTLCANEYNNKIDCKNDDADEVQLAGGFVVPDTESEKNEGELICGDILEDDECEDITGDAMSLPLAIQNSPNDESNLQPSVLQDNIDGNNYISTRCYDQNIGDQHQQYNGDDDDVAEVIEEVLPDNNASNSCLENEDQDECTERQTMDSSELNVAEDSISIAAADDANEMTVEDTQNDERQNPVLANDGFHDDSTQDFVDSLLHPANETTNMFSTIPEETDNEGSNDIDNSVLTTENEIQSQNTDTSDGNRTETEITENEGNEHHLLTSESESQSIQCDDEDNEVGECQSQAHANNEPIGSFANSNNGWASGKDLGEEIEVFIVLDQSNCEVTAASNEVSTDSTEIPEQNLFLQRSDPEIHVIEDSVHDMPPVEDENSHGGNFAEEVLRDHDYDSEALSLSSVYIEEESKAHHDPSFGEDELRESHGEANQNETSTHHSKIESGEICPQALNDVEIEEIKCKNDEEEGSQEAIEEIIDEAPKAIDTALTTVVVEVEVTDDTSDQAQFTSESVHSPEVVDDYPAESIDPDPDCGIQVDDEDTTTYKNPTEAPSLDENDLASNADGSLSPPKLSPIRSVGSRRPNSESDESDYGDPPKLEKFE